jgi:purine-binding chemotaxis protein CheW
MTQLLAEQTDMASLRGEEIFAARARALATPLADERQDACLDLIVFDVATQKVALEARYVHAVIGLSEPTPIPGAPELLAGVINFRGAILPVFRLEHCLGSGEREQGSCTIVLGEQRPEFAFFAHAVEEVSGFSMAQLRAAPSQIMAGAPATLGVTDGALNILDGQALLNDQRFHVGQQAAKHI